GQDAPAPHPIFSIQPEPGRYDCGIRRYRGRSKWLAEKDRCLPGSGRRRMREGPDRAARGAGQEIVPALGGKDFRLEATCRFDAIGVLGRATEPDRPLLLLGLLA